MSRWSMAMGYQARSQGCCCPSQRLLGTPSSVAEEHHAPLACSCALWTAPDLRYVSRALPVSLCAEWDACAGTLLKV